MADDFQIDRAFLEKLERLTIRWRKSFAGLVGGHNASRFAGPGQEFLDHRNFHPGDDLRAVNWRAYMRLDKMFLKMFQVEPRVPVRLLLTVWVNSGAPSCQRATDPCVSETLFEVNFTVAKSGLLSRLKSPTATEKGATPAPKFATAPKLAAVHPAGVTGKLEPAISVT